MNIKIHQSEPGQDFYVKCNVCKQILSNWIGSTPCCGSIAYSCNEDGTQVGYTVNLFGHVTQ